MEEVALIIDELRSSTAISHCRICHEAEFESSQSLEAPCACSGTVKFAHRDCIQRWCNEKGSTICEICLQNYEPGYTATSKKSQSIEAAVTIRDSLQVRRTEHEQLGLRAVTTSDEEADDSDYSECTSAADRGAAFCRSFAFTFTGFLLLRHILEVLDGKADQYPFALLTVLVLRMSGIIIPMYIVVQTITAIQNSFHRRCHDVGDEISNDDDEDDEDDEEEDDRQRHHIV
ncbi:uncharacterized protein LOC116209899 [Punica granatum]|uniref:RING-CH-type domain-containing protein n=2 Tax=Punica granatum TaxID=22663 RepID=A0A218XMB5_PUNGR|nr:uncharacterized protein LOC116209899 [Punica granatum]OWM86093.1 hypothetical protein CDL15_Pgr010917 [Punica granatum]PKI44101.1 hypothetical protein CRG98_035513 [Punica granatum]